ncbi:MAG: pH regulation protein F [Clostridiales bacterium]|nr:pH regulation protein F [Bacillota bacterium]MEE0516853.1 monovalent cation/H+ antiporter complex subunit F [Anaerovoracaceae bacterium]PWL94645.1 MAG: pH regulation protein F [Clostridiales bacterium]
MDKFFVCYLIGIVLLTLIMLARLFINAGVYNRFIGILVMSTNVILILVLIGFVDGRRDMYVDIAISYAVLGFITSVIVAKILGSRSNKKEDNNGN